MAHPVILSVFSLLLLMTSETVVGQTLPTYSKELLSFLSVVNGHYTNAGQIAEEVKNGDSKHPVHNEMVHNARAVAIPALDGLLTIYMDESYNGQMIKKVIAIVSEGWDGEFFVSLHNVTNFSKFTAETVDYSNFEYGDISEYPLCEAAYEKLNNVNIFVGNFDCIFPGTSDYFGYASTYSCTGCRSIPKGNAPERRETIPYNLKQTKSYPLPDELLRGLVNFVDPCADS